MSETTYCPIEGGRVCGRGCTKLCLADIENQAVGDGARTAGTTTVARRRRPADELAEAHRRLAEPFDGYQSGYAYARARYGISTRHDAALLFLELNGVLEQPQGLTEPGRVRADDRWANPPLTGRGDFPRRDGDVLVLGPEVFASTSAPEADTVLNWRGMNFVPQTEGEPTDGPSEAAIPGGTA